MSVPQAHSIRVGWCEHGSLHVELLDEAGAVFARASMDRDTFARFIGESTDALEAVSHGGLAMMPIGGRA